MSYFTLFKAVSVRLLFGFHIWLCVYRLTEEKDHWGWWMVGAVAVLLLFVEASFTLGCNKHGEWRRFVPCIFIYLLGTVPALCLIEWTLLEKRLAFRDENNLDSCSRYIENTTSQVKVGAIAVPIELTSNNWSLAMQQVMVFLLVVGRWFLPKGKMSREKLSNMLLAHIGMAADILEFLSEGVQTDQIRCEKIIILIILCLWATSLLQFALELNHSLKQRKKSLSHVNESLIQRCGNSEVWGIIVIILMQDGPFLGMRLFLIIQYNILDQGLIFFTFKNILVVMLQLYRLWILLCLTWDAAEGKFSFRLVASIRNKSRAEPTSSGRQMSNTSSDRSHSITMGRENDAFDEEESRDYENPSSEDHSPPQSHHSIQPHSQQGRPQDIDFESSTQNGQGPRSTNTNPGPNQSQ